MKKVLKSIATAFLALFVFGAAVSFQPIPALLFALAAVTVFPPTNAYLKKLLTGKRLPGLLVYLGTFLCFIAGSVALDTKKGLYGAPVNDQAQAAAPTAPVADTLEVAPIPTCELVITKLAERNNHYWFSVEKFDTVNPMCYRELELYAKDFARDRYGTISISFFDSLPHFAVPVDGRMYGGEDNMKRELLFYRRIGEHEEVSFHKWR